MAWLRRTPQGYAASRKPAVLSAGVGIRAGFGIPHAGRAEGAWAGSQGACNCSTHRPPEPTLWQGDGDSPQPAVPPVTKPFCLLVFLHEHEKIETPQLPSQPLCLSYTITAAPPITKSQLAACQHSVEVQSVVIALPRQDWSKTSWLRWKAAMTTHELTKQQEEQLFYIIIIKKKALPQQNCNLHLP